MNGNILEQELFGDIIKLTYFYYFLLLFDCCILYLQLIKLVCPVGELAI